jgi:hypothetical protein
MWKMEMLYLFMYCGKALLQWMQKCHAQCHV